MSQQDFLVEIGTEELPPTALKGLQDAFLQGIEKGLQQAELAFSATKAYASPRRLAVLVEGLQSQQADNEVERRGPAVAAAFDAEGQPTKALQGFARSCGADISALETLETDKGAWLVYREQQVGQHASTLLPEIVRQSLAALPIPKRMRWGSSDEEFVRPVHWIVLLLGDAVIDADILGVTAGRLTYGHRFHHPAALTVTSAKAYEALLHENAFVLADFDNRRTLIREQVIAKATELGGIAVIDDDLLDEVTGLVEWPVAIAGQFESRFLELPAEALISSMQGHQKYFPVRNADKGLLPYFITVSNLQSTDPAQIIAGNERVIRPRLTDAAFFWETDRKRPLSARGEQLKTIVFQNQLGTVYEKSQRVARLAGFIAEQLGGDAQQAIRAGELAKCDLVTEMVGEFPELQGIMGRYYAVLDNEPADVATAMEEQYLPRFAGDSLPKTITGQALSLAEKIDTLTGLFGIGQPPSGTKDPFALRRAALGVLRILVEQKLDLDLYELLRYSAGGFESRLTETNTVDAVFSYVMERMRAYAADAGLTVDLYEAVLAVKPTRPLDFMQRLQAVSAFSQLPSAEALAASNKRIDNILRKNSVDPTAVNLQAGLLQEPAEQALAAKVQQTQQKIAPAVTQRDYAAVLTELAELQAEIDQFFNDVMVMSEDVAVRDNRLALLNQTRALFIEVADISYLQQ